MQACAKCYNCILFDDNSLSTCSKCVQWDVDRNDGLLNFDPPKQFPITEITSASRKLCPVTMMYDTMKTAVFKAHERFVSGDWSIKNVKAFLWVNGLNMHAITSIIKCASNAKVLQEMEEDRDQFSHDYAAMIHDK